MGGGGGGGGEVSFLAFTSGRSRLEASALCRRSSALCRRASALCRRPSALCRSAFALCRRPFALCRRASALCQRSSAHGSPPLNVGYLRSTSETLRLSAEEVRCLCGPLYVGVHQWATVAKPSAHAAYQTNNTRFCHAAV